MAAEKDSFLLGLWEAKVSEPLANTSVTRVLISFYKTGSGTRGYVRLVFIEEMRLMFNIDFNLDESGNALKVESTGKMVTLNLKKSITTGSKAKSEAITSRRKLFSTGNIQTAE